MAKILPFGRQQTESRTPEDRIAAGDLRKSMLVKCEKCDWQGWLPAVKQNCPQCGWFELLVVHEQELNYPRA